LLDVTKRVARAEQTLAPRVPILLFIKSTEYLDNPVSSIQYPASLPITGARCCPNNMINFHHPSFSHFFDFSEAPFLSDLIIAFFNFTKTVSGKVCKFFRKTFGNNRIGVKIFDKFFEAGLDFLIG
jgi:hypothetical protein